MPELTEREQRYREALAEWDRRLRPEIEAIERSERLTAKDLAVVINCRGECED